MGIYALPVLQPVPVICQMCKGNYPFPYLLRVSSVHPFACAIVRSFSLLASAVHTIVFNVLHTKIVLVKYSCVIRRQVLQNVINNNKKRRSRSSQPAAEPGRYETKEQQRKWSFRSNEEITSNMLLIAQQAIGTS